MRSRWGYVAAAVVLLTGAALALGLGLANADSVTRPTKGFQHVDATDGTVRLDGAGRYDVVYERGQPSSLGVGPLSLAVSSAPGVRRAEAVTGPGDRVLDLDEDTTATTRVGFFRVFEPGAYGVKVQPHPPPGTVKVGQLPSLRWTVHAGVLVAAGVVSGLVLAIATFARRHHVWRRAHRPGAFSQPAPTSGWSGV